LTMGRNCAEEDAAWCTGVLGVPARSRARAHTEIAR